MKHSALVALSLLGLPAVAFGQTDWSVSTSVEQRAVLLEEFTGLYCGWCPEGHKVANSILSGMPGQAYAVNIHAGHYAEPNYGQPDYRTAVGDSIHKFFGVDGYPSGIVNRELWDGYYVTNRGEWIGQASHVASTDAPVNLYLQSSYDGATGKLTVHVEGYYTADATGLGTQTLSVLWTQDDIVGYQSSGGSDYHHNHMLRDYISPVWGDTIATATAGTYFSKDYVYDVPAAVNDVAVVPGDIQVIAFVTADKVNVENVTGGRPSFSNYNQTEKGAIFTPQLEVGSRWGYNYFEVKLKNKSSKVLRTATFDVTVNGNTQSETVDVDIDQFETATVTVPATLSYAKNGKTKYAIVLTALNGVAVTPDTISGGFQKPVVCTTSGVTLDLATDEAADEVTFALKDQDGNVVRQYGPFEAGAVTTIAETIEGLENGKTYCLECRDSYGNGLLSESKGHIILRNTNGKLLEQQYSISGYGYRSFFTVDTSTGISSVAADEAAAPVYYTLSGQQTSQPRGIVVRKDGRSARTIIIK